MPLKVGVISEKLGTYDAATTTLIAQEAVERKHQVYAIRPENIGSLNSRITAIAMAYDGNEESGSKSVIGLDELDVIHYRQNPPVDMAYLTNLYLLNTISDKVLIINSPAALIKFPEKILPLDYPEYLPPTLFTSDIEEIKSFIQEYNEIIIKPVYEFSGNHILKISRDELASREEEIKEFLASQKIKVIAQKFIPEVNTGDKRILLINGEVEHAFLRVPANNSHLANIAQGGTLKKTTLTEKEKHFCETIKPLLIENGIYICGLDFIGEYLTEINITSVAGFTWAHDLYGTKPEANLWDIIERKF